jgi:hypothetical protein
MAMADDSETVAKRTIWCITLRLSPADDDRMVTNGMLQDGDYQGLLQMSQMRIWWLYMFPTCAY